MLAEGQQSHLSAISLSSKLGSRGCYRDLLRIGRGQLSGHGSEGRGRARGRRVVQMLDWRGGAGPLVCISVSVDPEGVALLPARRR